MRKPKKMTRRLGLIFLSMSLIGVLYGWTVYAADPFGINLTVNSGTSQDSPLLDNDVNAVATTITSGAPINTPPVQQGLISTILPPGISDIAKQFISQINEGALSVLNNNIQTDLFGASIVPVQQAMVARHFGGYCMSPQESGICPQDPLLQFGDVKVTSILSGTAYDSTRAQAAQDFLTNLFVPSTGPLVSNFASKTLNANTVTADPKLLKSYTQALTDSTVLSVAREPFSEMMAKRTVPGSGAGGVSEMQLMEAEAIKRYMSAAWVQKMTPSPSPTTAIAMQALSLQIQQEQAQMQAYQNWMAYQQYRQMERVEALLAVQVIQNMKMAQALSTSTNAPTTSDLSNINQSFGGSGAPSSGTGTGQ